MGTSHPVERPLRRSLFAALLAFLGLGRARPVAAARIVERDGWILHSEDR